MYACWSDENQVQQRNEETPADDPIPCREDRLGAFVAHVFGDLRDRLQESIQRETDLHDFRPTIVGRMNFGFAPEFRGFSCGAGPPFLRQQVRRLAGHVEVLIWARSAAPSVYSVYMMRRS